MRKYAGFPIGVLLSLLFLSACTPAVPTAEKRFFFPPPPDVPRIEYIQGYFSDHDLKPKLKSFMTEYILGEARPNALFTSPVDVASDGKGRVYVTDSGSRQVFVLNLLQHTSKTLSSLVSADGMERGFGFPFGVAVDHDGRLYVSDVISKRVEVFDADERYLFSMNDPDLVRPTAIAIDSLHNVIYVADTAQHKLARFDMQGQLLGYMGSRGVEPGQFNFPTDVDVDAQGNVYVLDALNARVQVFDETGRFLRMFGERGTAEGSFEMPKNLAVTDTGQVYVTDALAHKVVVFSHEGELLMRIGGKSVVKKGISPGGFYMPRGIAVDKAGGIWVVDTLNRMVHKFQFLTPEYLREHPINPVAVQGQ